MYNKEEIIMTQEEKAKAYDDALTKARNIVNSINVKLIGKDIFETVFPELAENEDERIRKELLKAFRESEDSLYMVLTPHRRESFITWLEKQGEQKPQGKSALEAANEEKVDNQNCVKPTDKVEPKFHKGEWITNGDYTWKIIEIKPLDYILQSQDGNIVDDTISHVDEQFHSFTMEDAKDGDVLYNDDSFAGNSVFIYKGCISDKTDACLYYTRLFKDKDFSIYNDVMWENGGGVSGGKFYPATKEQRDLLFQKTKEAGYEWNAEKKKLKKIEHNPAWSEEDEDNFKHLLDEIVCLGNNRNSANRLYYDRLIKFIKELKNRAQPKEKWCDKDERMLDRLIAYFEKQVAFTDDDNPRYANWLKSIHPQKQWKPTKEQMEAISLAVHDSHSRSYHKELYSLKLDLSKLTK